MTAIPPLIKTASAQVSVSTTAELVPARRARRRVVIQNESASTILYLGPSGVTTANGFPVRPERSIALYVNDAVHAVSASGTITASYIEEYEQ